MQAQQVIIPGRICLFTLAENVGVPLNSLLVSLEGSYVMHIPRRSESDVEFNRAPG
jgi:hypothetical protein